MTEEFIKTTLTTLNDDSLIEVFKRMEPSSTLRLCQINDTFREFCNQAQLWRILMKAHFPDFEMTDEPRIQYQALASNIETTYHLIGGLEDIGDLGEILYLTYRETEENEGVPVWEIKVRGRPLANGVKKWVGMIAGETRQYFSTDSWEEFDLYNTQEEAVDDILSRAYPIFLDELRLYADQEIGAVNNATIDDAAEELDIHNPVNMIEWKDWMMGGSGFYMDYNSSTIRADVFEVTIQND